MSVGCVLAGSGTDPPVDICEVGMTGVQASTRQISTMMSEYAMISLSSAARLHFYSHPA